MAAPAPDHPAPMTAPQASGAGEPAPDRAAVWEDYVDILYAPSRVFARRAQAGFWLPLLVVTVLGAAIFYASFDALSPIMDAEFARSMAAGMKRGATAEQMQRGREIGEKLVRVMAVVAPPVLIVLTGVLLWIAGRLVGARQSLNAAVVVASFAAIPRVLASLAGAAQALFMDPSALTSRYAIGLGPARLLDASGAAPALVAIAGRFDLFVLWSTALLAIGLAVTGRVPRRRAMLAAALVWLVSSLPEVVGALER